MPLTTSSPRAVEAGTTQPPGHMQNEKHAAPFDRLGDAIGGVRQERVARGAAVLNTVDQGLRVLDAHAEREGLGLERHPGLDQPLEHVPRRMTRGEHHGVARDFSPVGESDPGRGALAGAAFEQEPDHARAELELLADRLQPLAQ